MLSAQGRPSLRTSGSSSQHPKVRTEKKGDIIHIKEQLRAACTETVTAQDGIAETDAMKLGLALDEWIEYTMEMAAPNISINGMDFYQAFEDVVEYEPIDETLTSQLDHTLQQRDELLTRLAEYRKEVPKRFSAGIGEDQRRISECMLREAERILTEQAKDEMEEDLAAGPNMNDLQELYAQVFETPQELSEKIPSFYSRLQRAETVLSELMAETNSGSSSTFPTPPTPKRRGLPQGAGTVGEDLTPRRSRTGLLKVLEAEGK
ncbi:hypothetical protein BC832DRAFT_588436 [Gaertneriomyces semiglobifer]|nr:hypothetical protein BC832DRAFT_588436 [Gaertneriomyces semiglobifer]